VWTRISQVVGSLVLLLIVLLVVFMVSMRAKYPPVLTAVRRMNKATWNPRSMKTAGQPGAYASVIRHVGRTSGTPYETPIGAVETEDGFVVALPYGTNPDWLKNVLAAGSAVLVHEGNTCQVDHPEVVPAAVGNAFFTPRVQRALRVFGIDDFILLRRTESA
jgi:deazaflavin-dependent oxidoreductase (nitroreductase family)